jgi:hypothetical protein
VVATHFPFPDRGLFFARVHAERSYCVAAPFRGEPPEGMFISASSPTRSIRFHPVGGRELLIVGGESHKVGQGGRTSPRYLALEEFARRHFGVREIAYRWSAQDNYSADGAPLVGKLTPRSQGTYAATGFRKWGLAMGAAAAEMITDAIAGRPNAWQEFFDSNRLTPIASARIWPPRTPTWAFTSSRTGSPAAPPTRPAISRPERGKWRPGTAGRWRSPEPRMAWCMRSRPAAPTWAA